MRARAFHCLGLMAVLAFLAIPLFGQADTEKTASAGENENSAHLGYPHDWSSQHLLMPGKADAVLAAGDRDPRYVYNMVMRQVAIQRFRHPLNSRLTRKEHIDWAVSLENGYVPQNQFPVKFQFDVTAENCTSDYVLFGLTLTSATSTQANIVGINNLYTAASPECNNGSPWVAFAYKATTEGGQITTSPELSEDGTKVAFVESVASGTKEGSYFHVLALPNPLPTNPTHDGTVISPLTPSTCSTPTTVGCETTLTIQTSKGDSNSSPWIDYNNDTVYVGADNGVLYKITPVFGGGTPALISNTNWPVTVSTNAYNNILTAPVVDDTAGLIFVGDGEGYLYSISLSAPAKTISATQTVGWAYDGTADGSGKPGTGVVDPPIAVTDPNNPTTDQVFAFTGCSEVLGIGGAVTQLPANFTTGDATTSDTVNLGSASGDGDCTGLNVHSGTFDNEFWLTGSASGHFIACGFVNDGGAPSNAEMYFFPFASDVITNTGSSSFVINTTKGQECSPLTEFYNGTSDMLFFGVGDATGTSYVESSTISSSLTTPNCTDTPTSTCVTSPDALGGTSGIVIDNELSNGGTNIYFSTLAAGSVNGQKCNVTGGTANPYCAVKLTQAGLQ
jgi:hypothetical protein